MNDRLHMDLELKGEIIKVLRAERERDAERAREQAALMAAVTAEWHQRSAALVLLLSEPDLAAARNAADQLASAGAELADYTAALEGELTLALEPLHFRQLLSHLETRFAIELRVAANVPERVLTDQARLTRVLTNFISEGIDAAAGHGLLLEVTSLDVSSDEADAGSSLSQVTFAVRHSDLLTSGAPAAMTGPPAPMRRLRAALARALCALMDVTATRDCLTIPLQIAADQAHTGMFRLAMSEPGASVAEGGVLERTRPGNPVSAIEGAIDFMYLDRQLGSLAPVVLARTAPAFIARAQRRMTDLHVAYDIEDLERLRALAHAWKGSALTVGARALATLLEAIEKQSAAGRLPGPGPLWQLRGALDQVVRALENHERA
jgi:HPt (histidine-containing phosphotransfer) domain-containing protein